MAPAPPLTDLIATVQADASAADPLTHLATASATAAGNAGDIAWDADHVYVCVAANAWKRTALAAW